MPTELKFLPIALYPLVMWFGVKYCARFEFWPECKRSKRLHEFCIAVLYLICPTLVCAPIWHLLPDEDQQNFAGILSGWLWLAHGYVFYELTLMAVRSLQWEIHGAAEAMIPWFNELAKTNRQLLDKREELRKRHELSDYRSTATKKMTWEEVKEYKTIETALARLAENVRLCESQSGFHPVNGVASESCPIEA